VTICYDEPLVCYDDSLYLYDGVLFTSQICPLEFEACVEKDVSLEACAGIEELVICVLEDADYEAFVGGEEHTACVVNLAELEICTTRTIEIEACAPRYISLPEVAASRTLGLWVVALQAMAREADVPEVFEFEKAEGLTEMEAIGVRK